MENYLDYPLTQQIDDFLNGKWYITVNALDTQNTIRGQLQLTSNFYAYMASESTFPPAFGSPKRGITLSYYSVANPTRTATFDICHNVVRFSRQFLDTFHKTNKLHFTNNNYFYDNNDKIISR